MCFCARPRATVYFVADMDSSYVGPFAAFMDGPWYEWSTLRRKGLGTNSPGYVWSGVRIVQGTNSAEIITSRSEGLWVKFMDVGVAVSRIP